MFKNEMTRKFPCWDCAKYVPPSGQRYSCKILDSFLDSLPVGIKEPGKSAVSCLTFKCTELQYKEPTKVLIEKLGATGMLRAALTYQENRVRLFFYEYAYRSDGTLIEQLFNIWRDFKLLTRKPMVIVLEHFDSLSKWRDVSKWDVVEKAYIIDQTLVRIENFEKVGKLPQPGTSEHEYNRNFNPLANMIPPEED